MANRSDREQGQPNGRSRHYSLLNEMGLSSRIPSGPAVLHRLHQQAEQRAAPDPTPKLQFTLATREPSTESVRSWKARSAVSTCTCGSLQPCRCRSAGAQAWTVRRLAGVSINRVPCGGCRSLQQNWTPIIKAAATRRSAGRMSVVHRGSNAATDANQALVWRVRPRPPDHRQ